MQKWLKERFNSWVALGTAGTTIVLCILCGLIIYLFWENDSSIQGQERAIITVIPFPTGTPTFPPTLIASQASHQPNNEGLMIGQLVQVSKTATGGLNLRSAPGVNNPSLYLAYEEETFLIQDGPVTADGYTWWNLSAPGDPTHHGWAVSDFLDVTTPPS